MTGVIVLAEQEWRARREAYVSRMRKWVEPHQERKALGQKHPVLDFLFSYYSYRPTRLLRWHPGPDVALAGDASEFLAWTGYVQTPQGVLVSRDLLTPQRRESVAFVRSLLAATESRAPRLGCFGLHEWAMVYRSSEIRHESWPLRLGSAGTDTVVESLPIKCGHFDAFRFFTPEARPLNTLQPARVTQIDLEQPGCLHANMDLFKWCYKLAPFTPSELIAECFELASDVRELDMRASPYDLRELGYSPVPIETPAGRATYARLQAEFATRAAPLRSQLIALCTQLLDRADND
ncbi:3-methyladenine DNA glycosylase [Kibdelosporangium philippinense]|uniref:3-methyladenine DNA glycosylase n=1 Tax=Kibdelosporangium philippinense TaxID=211113 RepID=A0ABS8ZWT5_9PSEU|nr:3-methyladenine DNA glycosylase [Kibdelosporangium philippinense]MCE7012112.1 3-methyladenine DNA glycosylase [Kibdelosporangium philippinense]